MSFGLNICVCSSHYFPSSPPLIFRKDFFLKNPICLSYTKRPNQSYLSQSCILEAFYLWGWGRWPRGVSPPLSHPPLLWAPCWLLSRDGLWAGRCYGYVSNESWLFQALREGTEPGIGGGGLAQLCDHGPVMSFLGLSFPPLKMGT